MTELKTLKDFGNYDGMHGCDKRQLKAEAIKWYHRSDDNKHKFIREFFNITSEDLKWNSIQSKGG